MLASSHLGSWNGPNRLWVTDPTTPARSDGTLEIESDTVRYTWMGDDKPQTGVIALSGPPAAMRADWTDSWHAADGLVLHGTFHEGLVRLFGTYPAGDGPDWGWQIELDTRDPDAFVLRMFNVVPGHGPLPAVVLHGTRQG